jgi:hypothetical protein
MLILERILDQFNSTFGIPRDRKNSVVYEMDTILMVNVVLSCLMSLLELPTGTYQTGIVGVDTIPRS